jgi:hypothetical protein
MRKPREKVKVFPFNLNIACNLHFYKKYVSNKNENGKSCFNFTGNFSEIKNRKCVKSDLKRVFEN